MIAYGAEAGRPPRRARALRGARRRRSRPAAPACERDAAAAAADLVGAPARAAADRSARAIEGHLRELAMPHATVEIEVEPGEPTDDGADQVTFLLAPNPGEPARPLARAASGGELSRAMLAVRVVLSEAPPTLVFDEVDAGIGGEAGAAVGRLLADAGQRGTRCSASRTSRRSQRSPGPQVVVEKAGGTDSRQGRAARWRTWQTVVDGDERVAELSRMLAGVRRLVARRAGTPPSCSTPRVTHAAGRAAPGAGGRSLMARGSVGASGRRTVRHPGRRRASTGAPRT